MLFDIPFAKSGSSALLEKSSEESIRIADGVGEIGHHDARKQST